MSLLSQTSYFLSLKLSQTSCFLSLQLPRLRKSLAVRQLIEILLPEQWICENGGAATRPMAVPESSLWRAVDTHTHTHLLLTNDSISVSLQCTRARGLKMETSPALEAQGLLGSSRISVFETDLVSSPHLSVLGASS